MSKKPIREDKNCLNCGDFVENRFCGKCGQQNVETRQSFSSLVFHFFEDFTHYDNAFWRTIKYLLFHPTRLTREYISGRRISFVPPVKLYIFISFITFLVPSLLPVDETSEDEDMKAINEQKNDSHRNTFFKVIEKVNSKKELDSLQNSLNKAEKIGFIDYWLLTKELERGKREAYNADMFSRLEESLFFKLPKALFLYLPIFGLWLWLFHGKRRWYFYDHAIFTLHYFSFVLLFITITNIIGEIILLLDNEKVRDNLGLGLGIVFTSWVFMYFYIAHKRMYKESFMVSFIKVSALIFINLLSLLALMIGLFFYTWMNVK